MIYDIYFSLQSENLLPPDKRKPKIIALLTAFVSALQTIRDLFFTEYTDGYSGILWDVATPYVLGDKVRHIDRAVYEAIEPSTGVLPTDTDYWVKIQDVYVGLRERMRYNSRTMVLEFILNKWFEITLTVPWTRANQVNQIYIVNNHLYGSGFMMGATGETSSTMPNSSVNQSFYLSNAFNYSTYTFSIYVPVAVFNALDADPTNAENIIRAIADKYVISGMLYEVVTY